MIGLLSCVVAQSTGGVKVTVWLPAAAVKPLVLSVTVRFCQAVPSQYFHCTTPPTPEVADRDGDLVEGLDMADVEAVATASVAGKGSTSPAAALLKSPVSST